MKRKLADYEWRYYEWPKDKISKNMHGISFDSDDVIGHLSTFFESLNEVDDNFYVYDLNEEKMKELAPHAKTKAIKHTERVFAYELYHQWSRRICKAEGWELNAELFKHLDWFYQTKENIKEENSYKSYPDMVLHRGQDVDDQMIVCEIKRGYRIKNDIVDDIIRLYRFTRTDNQQKLFKAYHCGVFLAINAEMNEIVENILSHSIYLSELIDSYSVDNIICVASRTDKIVFQSFGEIVRQLKCNGLLPSTPITQIKHLPKKRTHSPQK